MRKTLCKILAKSWQGQAAYLQGLSRMELEVLWHEVQADREGFERFRLAVYSILRDLYESENRRSRRNRRGTLEKKSQHDIYRIARERLIEGIGKLSFDELNVLLHRLNRIGLYSVWFCVLCSCSAPADNNRFRNRVRVASSSPFRALVRCFASQIASNRSVTIR